MFLVCFHRYSLYLAISHIDNFRKSKCKGTDDHNEQQHTVQNMQINDQSERTVSRERICIYIAYYSGRTAGSLEGLSCGLTTNFTFRIPWGGADGGATSGVAGDANPEEAAEWPRGESG